MGIGAGDYSIFWYTPKIGGQKYSLKLIEVDRILDIHHQNEEEVLVDSPNQIHKEGGISEEGESGTAL